jgi:putative DNA-invertase from lambdoid prophage Rac
MNAMHTYNCRAHIVHAYTRVSSLEQAEGGYSLGQQEHLLTLHAKLQYPDREFRLWTDAGVSGSIPLANRRAGGGLVAALRAGDILIVSRLDRIFRNMLDALNQVERFTRHEIAFIALDLGEAPIGQIGSAEQLRFHLLSAAAEFERSRLRERLADSLETRRRAGKPLSSNAPFGFRREGKGREARLVVEPREQVIVNLIYNLYEAGHYYEAIAREVARRGHCNRFGKVMPGSVIRNLLIKGGRVSGSLTKEQWGAHLKAAFTPARKTALASDPRIVAALERGRITYRAQRDARDAALLPIIRKLRAAGITTYSGVAVKLNEAGIPSPTRGKKWAQPTLRATMIRFGLFTPYRWANASTIVPVICRIIASGNDTYNGIAAALNAAGVPPARGVRWHGRTVSKVMLRFDMTLNRSSSGYTDPRRIAALQRARVTQKAQREARDAAILPVIRKLLAIGITTYCGVTAKLNAAGVPAAKGGRWYDSTVRKIMLRSRITFNTEIKY